MNLNSAKNRYHGFYYLINYSRFHHPYPLMLLFHEHLNNVLDHDKRINNRYPGNFLKMSILSIDSINAMLFWSQQEEHPKNGGSTSAGG